MNEDQPATPELIVVMPVYNEEDAVGGVIEAWLAALEGAGAAFRLLLLDDGSTDGTPDVLSRYKADPRLEIVRKPNSGHGPTILEGYRRAVGQAPWVFQVDSDGELPPEPFAELWSRREDYDVLLGERTDRRQGLGRRALSAGSRAVVRLVFGAGVRDVNVPYRLMRSAQLGCFLDFLPPDTFAPNVILSGMFNRAGLRVYQHPIPVRPRAAGKSSLVRWRLWRASVLALAQTLRLGLQSRAKRGSGVQGS
jgi:glycosyltransferase involved in cell wall biosynthesis